MIKIIIAMLVALSLAAAPGSAFAAPSSGCTMPGAESGMAMDHEKMGCCTAECAIPAPAAVLPVDALEVSKADPVSGPSATLKANSLPSINLAAVDPPPRNLFA